jgi:hypothetical protein
MVLQLLGVECIMKLNRAGISVPFSGSLRLGIQVDESRVKLGTNREITLNGVRSIPMKLVIPGGSGQVETVLA